MAHSTHGAMVPDAIDADPNDVTCHGVQLVPPTQISSSTSGFHRSPRQVRKTICKGKRGLSVLAKIRSCSRGRSSPRPQTRRCIKGTGSGVSAVSASVRPLRSTPPKLSAAFNFMQTYVDAARGLLDDAEHQTGAVWKDRSMLMLLHHGTPRSTIVPLRTVNNSTMTRVSYSSPCAVAGTQHVVGVLRVPHGGAGS